MRLRSTWLILLAGFLVVTGAGVAHAADPTQSDVLPPLGATVVPGSEQQIAVVFVDRIVNYGKTPIQAAQIRMHTPVELPQQTVTMQEVEGRPARAKDRWGATVLTYNQAKIAPGQTMTGRWTATATIRQYVWDLGRSNDLAGSGNPTLSLQDEQR